MGNKTNKTTIVTKQKIVIEEKKPTTDIHDKGKGGMCGCCFGGKKPVQETKKSVIRPDQRTSYIHDTRKSSIVVKSQPHIQIDDKLFANKDKKLLDIKMKRA